MQHAMVLLCAFLFEGEERPVSLKKADGENMGTISELFVSANHGPLEVPDIGLQVTFQVGDLTWEGDSAFSINDTRKKPGDMEDVQLIEVVCRYLVEVAWGEDVYHVEVTQDGSGETLGSIRLLISAIIDDCKNADPVQVQPPLDCFLSCGEETPLHETDTELSTLGWTFSNRPTNAQLVNAPETAKPPAKAPATDRVTRGDRSRRILAKQSASRGRGRGASTK